MRAQPARRSHAHVADTVAPPASPLDLPPSLDPAAEKLPLEVEAAAPSPEEADAFSRQQWEALLLYLGASGNVPPALPRDLAAGGGQDPLNVPALLAAAGLVIKGEGMEPPGERGVCCCPTRVARCPASGRGCFAHP